MKKTAGFTLIRTLRCKNLIRVHKGFTLIELLVVISILGILLALSIFGMQGARQASRDGKRKADLEQIRSGLEMYRSDCDKYPTSGLTAGGVLKGSSDSGNCLVGNIYIGKIPGDPLTATNTYAYSSADGSKYTLCAALEQIPSSPDIAGCGSCTVACNYKVTNP